MKARNAPRLPSVKIAISPRLRARRSPTARSRSDVAVDREAVARSRREEVTVRNSHSVPAPSARKPARRMSSVTGRRPCNSSCRRCAAARNSSGSHGSAAARARCSFKSVMRRHHLRQLSRRCVGLWGGSLWCLSISCERPGPAAIQKAAGPVAAAPAAGRGWHRLANSQ